MSGRVLKWVGFIAFIITVSTMGLYLFTRDKLEVADQSASVIGAFLTLISLAVTLYGTLTDRLARSTSTPTDPEETITAAKKALTALVARQWRTEAAIRALDDPEPIPISWHLIDDASLMDHPRLVGEHLLTFGGSSGQIPKLVRAFRELRRRRLVITGGPGTGKTTLAIQFLLHLVGPGRDAADPVPVLLPVNSWDTNVHPRLYDWLAVRLPMDYPALTAPQFGADATKALLDHGHIMPILDGLDEIPDDARTHVINALNRWLGNDDSFVLTSRITEYDHAVKQAGDVLNAAAVIAPALISAADAETYLRTCLPPLPRHDWTPIWAALQDGSHPGLSRLAETALGLWLIRTVYIIPAAAPAPAPLTGPLAQEEATLRAHLFDHLIAAVIDSRPPSSDPAEHFRPRTAWNPDRARDHLTYLARVLRDHDTYDLAWWQLAQHTIPHAGRRRITWQAGLIGGLISGLAGMSIYQLAGGLVAMFVGGHMVMRTFGRGKWFVETPGYANLQLSGRRTDLIKHVRHALANWPAPLVLLMPFALFAFLVQTLAFIDVSMLNDIFASMSMILFWARDAIPVPLLLPLWFAVMLTFMFGFLFASWLIFILTLGLAGRIAIGVIKWAEQPAFSTIATTPLASWKADRTLTLLRVTTLVIMIGFAVGLITGFSIALMGELMLGLMIGLEVGLAFGLTVGPVVGLMVGNHHAWLVYTIAARRLAKRGDLPRNLMAFLDDAHRLGLLRTVGPIYQFRHAELQDHFAAPSPSSRPTGTAVTPRSTENVI